jgi:hypothetical protein
MPCAALVVVADAVGSEEVDQLVTYFGCQHRGLELGALDRCRLL